MIKKNSTIVEIDNVSDVINSFSSEFDILNSETPFVLKRLSEECSYLENAGFELKSFSINDSNVKDMMSYIDSFSDSIKWYLENMLDGDIEIEKNIPSSKAAVSNVSRGPVKLANRSVSSSSMDIETKVKTNTDAVKINTNIDPFTIKKEELNKLKDTKQVLQELDTARTNVEKTNINQIRDVKVQTSHIDESLFRGNKQALTGILNNRTDLDAKRLDTSQSNIARVDLGMIKESLARGTNFSDANINVNKTNINGILNNATNLDTQQLDTSNSNVSKIALAANNLAKTAQEPQLTMEKIDINTEKKGIANVINEKTDLNVAEYKANYTDFVDNAPPKPNPSNPTNVIQQPSAVKNTLEEAAGSVSKIATGTNASVATVGMGASINRSNNGTL